MKTQPSKERIVKAWACYQPATKEIWSVWPDKDMAERDRAKRAKEILIPVTIHLPAPRRPARKATKKK